MGTGAVVALSCTVRRLSPDVRFVETAGMEPPELLFGPVEGGTGRHECTRAPDASPAGRWAAEARAGGRRLRDDRHQAGGAAVCARELVEADFHD